MPEPDMRTLGLDMSTVKTCDGSDWNVEGLGDLLLRAACWMANYTFLYISTCDHVCEMLMRECEGHHSLESFLPSFLATLACFDQASLLVRPSKPSD